MAALPGQLAGLADPTAFTPGQAKTLSGTLHDSKARLYELPSRNGGSKGSVGRGLGLDTELWLGRPPAGALPAKTMAAQPKGPTFFQIRVSLAYFKHFQVLSLVTCVSLNLL